MERIRYIIENKEPLIFSERSNDATLYTTKKYIPGAAVRGMLANRYIHINKQKKETVHKDKTFFELFLSGKVCFLPAFPVPADELSKTLWLPPSIMRSKDGTIIKDISGKGAPEAGFKKMQGFVTCRQDSEKTCFYPVQIRTKINFHMARNHSDEERIAGKGFENNIFNYEYIEPGQYFQGEILIQQVDEKTIKELDELLKSGVFYLGRSKRVQYGMCEVIYKTDQETVRDFSVTDADEKIYLRAHTPYIPAHYWQRVDNLAGEVLTYFKQALEQRVGASTAAKIATSFDIADLFAGQVDVPGYLAVWQARRPTQTALAMGSLIPLKLSADLSEDEWQVFNQLLHEGIGCRREDGFGQFRFWIPCKHISWQEIDSASTSVCEPKTFSSLIKQNVQTIIRNRMIEEIRNQAEQDADAISAEADSIHHLLSRLESLMAGNRPQKEIQLLIGHDFRNIAKENLQHLKLKGTSLFDHLTHSDGLKPWHQEWKQRLERDESKQKELERDIDPDIFKLSDDEEYRLYWLWLFRHLREKSDKGVRR